VCGTWCRGEKDMCPKVGVSGPTCQLSGRQKESQAVGEEMNLGKTNKSSEEEGARIVGDKACLCPVMGVTHPCSVTLLEVSRVHPR
jgi:hypothetical protein